MKNCLPLFSAVVCLALGLNTACSPANTPSPQSSPALPTASPKLEPSAVPTVTPPTPSPTTDASQNPVSTPTPVITPSSEPSTAPSLAPSANPSPSVVPPLPSGVYRIYGLTTNQRLLSFLSDAPQVVLSSVAITGLALDENLVGIDFRAGDQRLYAVSNQSRIYTLDLSSGALTPVAQSAFSPPVNGSYFGLDFNPSQDQLRLHGNRGQNLRLNPDTVTVASQDGQLAYSVSDFHFSDVPLIVGTAYSPVTASAPSQLYAIDAELDLLVKWVNPNDGKISTVGPLNASTGVEVGFDISAEGQAYASLKDGAASSLYKINLTDGRASRIGNLGTGNINLIGLAIQPR